MPDEASPPKSEDTSGQAPKSEDTSGQAPKNEDVSGQAPQSGDTAMGQASEPEQFSSENLTGKPVTPPAAEPTTTATSPETVQPEIAPPPEAPPTDAPAVAGRQTESAPPQTEQSSEGAREASPGAVEAPGGSENLEAVIDTPKDKELPMGQATPQNTFVATPEPPSSVPDSAEAPHSQEATDGHGTTGKQDYGRAQQTAQTVAAQSTTTVIRPHGDLAAANAKIQATKRKKLDKIMEAIEGKGPTTLKLRRVNAITNDEVEKLLRVSDATATRYLDLLEKEGRVRQEGKTGKGVVYVKN